MSGQAVVVVIADRAAHRKAGHAGSLWLLACPHYFMAILDSEDSSCRATSELCRGRQPLCERIDPPQDYNPRAGSIGASYIESTPD